MEKARDSMVEALEYIELLFENMQDSDYKAMVIKKHAVELGAFQFFHNHAMGTFDDFVKRFGKKNKMGKETAEMMGGILMARFIKNLSKELSKEE